MPFVGWLVLFGLVLGAVEALLVFWRLVGANAALWWGMVSSIAWALGGVGSALSNSFFSSQGVFLAIPWVILGVGQGLVLAVVVRRRRRFRLALLAGSAWFGATAIGGVLFSALTWLTNSTGAYDSMEQVTGVVGAAVLRYMLFTALLYGIPSGAVLAWVGHTGVTRTVA